jgi:hypothetical protein
MPRYRSGQITLISGVPASGKTFFGDWLQAKKHFLHIDMESFQGSFAWRVSEAALRTGDFSLFCDYLREESPNVVLTFGFHPNDFHIVRSLQEAGVVTWWFNASREYARETFISRSGVSVGAFDFQIDAIEKAQAELKDFYGANTVENSRWAEQTSRTRNNL